MGSRGGAGAAGVGVLLALLRCSFLTSNSHAHGEGEPVPAWLLSGSPAASHSSTTAQVGRQLAVIGDAINQRYDEEFQTMLQRLQPTSENAYEYFTKIASR